MRMRWGPSASAQPDIQEQGKHLLKDWQGLCGSASATGTPALSAPVRHRQEGSGARLQHKQQ